MSRSACNAGGRFSRFLFGGADHPDAIGLFGSKRSPGVQPGRFRDWRVKSWVHDLLHCKGMDDPYLHAGVLQKIEEFMQGVIENRVINPPWTSLCRALQGFYPDLKIVEDRNKIARVAKLRCPDLWENLEAIRQEARGGDGGRSDELGE